MSKSKHVGVAVLAFTMCTGLAGAAWAANDQPITEKWAPSEWGKGDMAGAVNRTTAAMVLKAVKLVKQGKVATLGKVYQSDMPCSAYVAGS